MFIDLFAQTAEQQDLLGIDLCIVKKYLLKVFFSIFTSMFVKLVKDYFPFTQRLPLIVTEMSFHLIASRISARLNSIRL